MLYCDEVEAVLSRNRSRALQIKYGIALTPATVLSNNASILYRTVN